ncbi:MAG: glycosyltransferase family 39 protein [Anaerolineae bacterium]|nr:glycosyltransferase family 39 protein [Anaerolineae bacterium]NUQ05488.1 glycosyltransferase family 39 protein [Anaerolineae bacterium]
MTNRIPAPRAPFITVRLMTLLAIIFMIAAAAVLVETARLDAPNITRPETLYTLSPIAALPLAAVGGVLLIAAVTMARRLGALLPLMTLEAVSQDESARSRQIAWGYFIVGLALLGFVTLCSAGTPEAAFLPDVHWRVQFIAFAASLTLIAYGMAGAPRLRLPRLSRREMIAVAAVAALALALRVWGTDTTLRVLIDEQNYVDNVQRFQYLTTSGIVQRASAATPYTWMFSILQAEVGWLFGHNLTVLRLPSGILGAAQVVALYALGRTLFERRTALLAALALAALAPHLHYGRTIYSSHSGDALFGILALLFATRGLRRNQPLDWSLTGVCLGMTHYFYEAGRLFFAPLVLLWIIALVLWGKAEDGAPLRLRLWRDMRGGLARVVVCAVIVAAPVYIALLTRGEVLTYRLNQEGVNWQAFFAEGEPSERIVEAFAHATRPFWFTLYLPENSARYYGGTEPLILRPLTPFFLLGIAYLLARPRGPAVLVLLWVGAAVAANGLLIRENIWTPRYTVVVPALALVVGVAVSRVPLLLLASPSESLPRRAARRLLPAGLIAFFGVLNVVYYFGPHLDHLNTYHRRWLTFGDTFDVILRTHESLPNSTQLYLIGRPAPPTLEPHLFWEYLEGRGGLPQPIEMDPSLITARWLRSLPPGRSYAFFVETRWTNVIAQIYRHFPDAQLPQYTRTVVSPTEQFLLIYAP